MSNFNITRFIPKFTTTMSGYYLYNNNYYVSTFPEEWATNHLPSTGPDECQFCREFGFWNGVFIGYCGACAQFTYNGTRGRGFVSIGVENSNDFIDKYPSIFTTYMSNYTLENVGDESYQLSNYNLYEENNNIDNIDIDNIDYEYHMPEVTRKVAEYCLHDNDEENNNHHSLSNDDFEYMMNYPPSDDSPPDDPILIGFDSYTHYYDNDIHGDTGYCSY